MKKLFLLCIFFWTVFFSAWAQRNFYVEISGGPSHSFLSYENSAFEPYFRSYSRMAWQGSLKGYYELGNDLELGVQFDLIKRNHWRTFLYDTVSSFSFLGTMYFNWDLS